MSNMYDNLYYHPYDNLSCSNRRQRWPGTHLKQKRVRVVQKEDKFRVHIEIDVSAKSLGKLLTVTSEIEEEEGFKDAD